MASTSAERKAKERRLKKEQGMIMKQIWLPNETLQIVESYKDKNNCISDEDAINCLIKGVKMDRHAEINKHINAISQEAAKQAILLSEPTLSVDLDQDELMLYTFVNEMEVDVDLRMNEVKHFSLKDEIISALESHTGVLEEVERFSYLWNELKLNVDQAIDQARLKSQ